jgi:hypothetical protein
MAACAKPTAEAWQLTFGYISRHGYIISGAVHLGTSPYPIILRQ